MVSQVSITGSLSRLPTTWVVISFYTPSRVPYVSAWLASTPGFYAGADPPYEVSGCCKDFGFKATRVPEPHTLSLFGVGLLGLGFMRRKRAT